MCHSLDAALHIPHLMDLKPHKNIFLLRIQQSYREALSSLHEFHSFTVPGWFSVLLFMCEQGAIGILLRYHETFTRGR